MNGDRDYLCKKLPVGVGHPGPLFQNVTARRGKSWKEVEKQERKVPANTRILEFLECGSN